MKTYKLDKVVTMNTEFTMETYRAYVIEKWGTDDTAAVTARVDAKKVGEILTELAPLRMTTANWCGPLPLKEKPIVIPPDKTYKFEGTAGSFVRIVGKLIELAVGEALPADLTTRFGQQHNEYYTCLEGSDVGTGTGWADGAEVTLYTLTPKTNEIYLFDHRTLVDQVAAGSPAEAEGNVGVRWYLDGAPFDHILAATGRRGFSRFDMEIPNTTDNKGFYPFTLEPYPIKIPGDKTLDVNAMNVSGTTLFGTTEATFHWYGAALYKKMS